MDRKELKDVFGEKVLKNILEGMYIKDQLSTTEIENKFKAIYDVEASYNVIYLLLKDFNIPIRSISDSVSLASRTLDYSEDLLGKHPVMLEVMDGLLISDGSICSSKNEQKYHRFSISSSQKEFIDYCREYLGYLNPSETAKRASLGYARNKGYEKSRYSFYTSFHPCITKQRVRWYREGKKIVPKDIKITPLMLKMWYYGDGSIVNNKETNTCMIRLSTDGFAEEDVDFLVGSLETQTGIKSVNADNRIRIKSESIATFFNYMGRKSDIDCYSYKFDVDEWRFWKTMKDVSRELGIAYGRLSHLVKTHSVQFSRSPGGKKVCFTKEQIIKLKQLHMSGLLEADPRKNSAAVTKGCFKREPNTQKMYENILSKGFPYVDLSEAERVILFNRLNNIPTITIQNNEIIASYRDNDIVIYYHPHLFNVNCGGCRSPLEAFNEKKNLIELADKFLKKNIEPSKDSIRYEICRAKNTKRTSVFPVRVAKTLYTLYGADNMKTLDPCAGYSSRLMGFYTSFRGGEYVGIDPCKETYHGLLNTQKDIQPMTERHNATFYNGRAEIVMPQIKDSYDLIFTSPPYFDLEKYSDQETQSYRVFPNYEEWLDKFMFVLIRESYRLLKDDGVFLLNVADCRRYKIVEHVEAFAKSMFRIEKVLIMVAPSKFTDSFAEPIFVFRKK